MWGEVCVCVGGKVFVVVVVLFHVLVTIGMHG